MEDWLSKAEELFPELRGEDYKDHDIDTPMSMWIELSWMLMRAYEEEPVNDDLIGRIYDYAAWCFRQPQTEQAETDLSSAAAVGLIEDIPLQKKGF